MASFPAEVDEGNVASFKINRAGPVIVPERRMDSNIAARRGVHGFVGSVVEPSSKTDRSPGSMEASPSVSDSRASGSLIMSMTREVNVAWRLVRPPHMIITTRSVLRWV